MERPEPGVVETFPEHLLCSVCGQSLHFYNAATAAPEPVMYYKGEDAHMSLNVFIGTTLKCVVEELARTRAEALYGGNKCWWIYRPKRRGKVLGTNRRGVNGTYIVQKGDVGIFSVDCYAHFSCYRARLTREAIKHFSSLFCMAGFLDCAYETIAHGHFPPVTANQSWPWFLVHTNVGTIRIGHQATITNINWGQATSDDLSHLFTEDVTKRPDEVHAGGDNQTLDFLTRIRGALKASPVAS